MSGQEWVDVLKVEASKVVFIGVLSKGVGKSGAILRSGDGG